MRALIGEVVGFFPSILVMARLSCFSLSIFAHVHILTRPAFTLVTAWGISK